MGTGHRVRTHRRDRLGPRAAGEGGGDVGADHVDDPLEGDVLVVGAHGGRTIGRAKKSDRRIDTSVTRGKW